jgi:hypothetical protein
LGGAGYTRDFPVEQFYRDNRLNAIHEGTQGIHGIDLLGRKVAFDGGKAFELFTVRVNATAERALANEELAEFGSALSERLENLHSTTLKLSAEPSITVRLANSNAYLEAFGHIVVAWIWLEQMLIAESQSAFHKAKRQTGQFFFRWELPRVDNQLRRLAELDNTCLAMEPDWF